MNITRNEHGKLLLDGQPVLLTYVRDGFAYREFFTDNDDVYELRKVRIGHKIGVVVAVPVDGQIRFGFSKVNTKMGDKFRRDLAVEIAVKRALFHEEIQPPFSTYKLNNQQVKIPTIVQDYLLMLREKAGRYFKYLQSSN